MAEAAEHLRAHEHPSVVSVGPVTGSALSHGNQDRPVALHELALALDSFATPPRADVLEHQRLIAALLVVALCIAAAAHGWLVGRAHISSELSCDAGYCIPGLSVSR